MEIRRCINSFFCSYVYNYTISTGPLYCHQAFWFLLSLISAANFHHCLFVSFSLANVISCMIDK